MNRALATCFLLLALASQSFGSAYNAQPKLVVVILIDQFRGDYLQRYHDEFGPGGFRRFTDEGAYFPDCEYNYATLVTGPGHASIGTGTYPSGHGILANDWYDPALGKRVTSVSDSATHLLGVEGASGASPLNLRADTFGDELRMATQGRSRVFGISLKDRAAILPAGFSANAAYWIDGKTGAWITSDYYMKALPGWVEAINHSDAARKYLGREWKDASGKMMGSTKTTPNDAESYFELVGRTPFANDLELDFAKSLITNEKLGTGPSTDLLIVSLSENDILGHGVGPDAPQLHASIVQLDRQLSAFFGFLDKQFGSQKFWLALSADHGVAPIPREVQKLRIRAAEIDETQWTTQLNDAIAKRTGKPGNYVLHTGLPIVELDAKAFGDRNEGESERLVGEELVKLGAIAAYTKSDLRDGRFPDTLLGHRFANSYSAYGPWYVFVQVPPFTIPAEDGTTHFSPYSYDTHVPLAFYGAPFVPGVYRTHSEPIDMAVTLSSVLGVNKPAAATGRVLSEAVRQQRPNPEVKSQHLVK